MAKRKINIEALSDDVLYSVSTPNLKKDVKEEKRGRPVISKEEATADVFTGVPTEEVYLQSYDMYLPFSTNIRADLYLKLKRIEFHKKHSIRVILEDLLEKFIDSEPSAETPLPEHKVKKLKQLKSPIEYYHLRKED
jgi:hypothetical protein